jgi:iron complex outermembrane receptor protein
MGSPLASRRVVLTAALAVCVLGLDGPASADDAPSLPSSVVPSPDGAAGKAEAPQPPDPAAQKNILDLSLEELGKVDVRPSTPSRASASPTATGSVLTTAESELTAPGSLGEFLNQAPSVAGRRTSALNLDPRIRGFHSGQIAAVANGMTQLKTRLDIDSLFSQIDPGIVESVTVIDGPYTSLYGPGFAFLLADLFAPPRYLNGPEHHGLVSFTYGTNGRQIYDRERFWGGDAHWSYMISYGIRVGNDYSPGHASDDFRVPSSYNQQDVFVALSADVTSQSRLEFNYIHQQLHDIELPGVAYDINFQHTNQFNARYVIQDCPTSPEQFVVQYWAQDTPFNGDATRESKRRTFSSFLIWEPVPELTNGNLVGRGETNSTGVRSLLTLGSKDSLCLSVGADWRRYSQRYLEQDFTADGVLAFGGTSYGLPRSSLEDVGIFAHLAEACGKDLTFTLGGRIDRTKTFVDSSDPQVQPPTFYIAGFNEPREILFMGYTTADYCCLDWLKFHGGVAYAMRNPNLTELYSNEPYVPWMRYGNSFIDGNSDLAPERDLQFDFAVTATWKKANFGARAFQSTIRDYILATAESNNSNFVPAGVAAPTNLQRNLSAFGLSPADPAVNFLASTHSVSYRYTNIREAELYGGELFGDIQFCPWLSLNCTLSYVRGINEAPVVFNYLTRTLQPLKANEALPGIYPLNSTLIVRIAEPHHNKWNVDFVTRMVAGQHHVADSLGELPTPGFTVFGVHAAYQLTPNLRLHTSFENLFDRTYTEHGSLVIADQKGNLSFVKERGFSWLIGFEARF